LADDEDRVEGQAPLLDPHKSTNMMTT
jgi:hypothetical protein